MRLMGIEAIPNLNSQPSTVSIGFTRTWDYEVTAANEVWSADITYIPMDKGFMYLEAILDIVDTGRSSTDYKGYKAMFESESQG